MFNVFVKPYQNILFFCGLLVMSLLFYHPRYFGSPACNPVNPLDQLIAHTLAPTPILDDLRYLTDTIGGRPTGSSAMNKATQWGLKRFGDAGLKDAYLDAYTAPRNWLPNIARGEIVATDTLGTRSGPLRLAAIPFTISTPPEGLVAPVYALDTAQVKDIEAHTDHIKAHWLLIPTTPMHTLEDLFKEYLETPPLFMAAKAAGAVGVLWLSNRPGRLLYRHNASLNGALVPLPAALIEREGGERMIRALKAGETVQFKAILDNLVQEKPRNHNVIAEIRGSEKPDEVIVLGAHLDSWDLGQGALDNGSNAVMVVDVARQIFALQQRGFRPRRTIRFMLYSGEELGLYGSWFDVKNHPALLDAIKAVIIYDIGTGRTTGFSLGGRSDMRTVVHDALEPIERLGPFTHTTDAFIGTDNFDYLLKGIPTLVANQDATPYLPYYHAESDTFDKVDARELKLNTVIAAVLTWNVANTTEPIPSRQSRGDIIQLLESTGVTKEMEIYNIWDDFIKHKR